MPPRYYAIYVPSPEHMFVPGIPARNLSPEEVELYGGIEILSNSRCYEFVPVDEFIPAEEEE